MTAYLTACSTERVVTRTEIVTVTETEFVNVPTDLTVPIAKQERPDGEITYGDTIGLWAEDRSTIDKLNGRLAAIESLGKEGG